MKTKYAGLFVVAILLIVIIFSISNTAISAYVADNVLRPLIGGKNTLTLESWYFNFDDKLKRMQYWIKKPNANIFTAQSAQTTFQLPSGRKSQIYLAPIPAQNNFSPMPSEGVWQVITQAAFPNLDVMAKTFIRPDPVRDYAIVSLVKIDLHKLSLGIQAGTYYPGGSKGKFGSGIVPKEIQQSNNLLAVFNGGFMEKDGHYGMIIGNKTYVPLRQGLATLLVYSNGSAQIVDYTGQVFDSTIIGARQNGPFLIKEGLIISFGEKGVDTWGRTTTNSMYTWRSGIGITKNGNLIYAVGNSLVPQTLAKALQAAGAVNAIQLDINSYWVRFILYNALGNGTYSYYPLLKEMHNGGKAYLSGNNKDFFYIYKKSL